MNTIHNIITYICIVFCPTVSVAQYECLEIMNVTENRQRTPNLRYVQIFGTSLGWLSQQKSDKEHPDTVDIAPVGY